MQVLDISIIDIWSGTKERMQAVIKRMLTAFTANLILDDLKSHKEYLSFQEGNYNTYICGDDKAIAKNDYQTFKEPIEILNKEIERLSDAIFAHYAAPVIEFEGEFLSANVIQLRINHLIQRKEKLDKLRRNSPVELIDASEKIPRYRHINYDLEVIEDDYNKTKHEIMMLQVALDSFEHVKFFEVEF